MKVAIMQPYFFPYIGYWQLINAVDRFVIYDDVNYIKGGWINRNRILINGKPAYMTVPLNQSSSYKRICDIGVQPTPVWRNKLLKMIEMTYRKAPYFPDVFPVIAKLIHYETNSLCDYLVYQLQMLSKFMRINTEFVATSRGYENNGHSGQARILDICKQEKAATYINAQGGQTLYESEAFQNAGVELNFISMCPLSYKQRVAGFTPNLSIIDALMEIGPIEIRDHLYAFNLSSNNSTGKLNLAQNRTFPGHLN